jgi:hypothetical protein
MGAEERAASVHSMAKKVNLGESATMIGLVASSVEVFPGQARKNTRQRKQSESEKMNESKLNRKRASR